MFYYCHPNQLNLMVLVLGISHGIGRAVYICCGIPVHGGDVGGIAMEWVGVFVNMCNH